MRVLVDSSVWIEHFRNDNQTLRQLLEKDLVSTHPLIVGELACGTPPDRKMTLMYLQRLSGVQIATWQETLDLIERDKLYGTGCGWVDIVLLASCLVTPVCRLWTLDKRLGQHAQRYGIAYEP